MSDHASNIIHRQNDTEPPSAAADDRQPREAATQRRTETGEIARLSPHDRPEAPLTSTDAIHRNEPGPPRRPRLTDRIAVIAGSTLLLVGAAAAVAAGLQEAAGGYVGSGVASFTTPTAAFTTGEIDIRGNTARAADPVNDLGDLAQVRISIRSSDPDVEIFAGVAPTADIRSYLRSVAHDAFDSATLEPFVATFRRSTGTSPPDDPQDQTFWVASSSGQGELTLDWDKRQGAWSLLIMRGDGSAGLDLEASIALRFAFLTPLAIGVLSAGALTLTGAAIVRAGRRNRADTQAGTSRKNIRSVDGPVVVFARHTRGRRTSPKRAAGASILVMVAGIIGMAGEWRFGQVTQAFLTTPQPRRVVAAKTIIYLGVGLVYGLAASVTATAAAAGWYRAKDLALPYERSAVWLTLLGCLAVSVLLGALGVAVGAIAPQPRRRDRGGSGMDGADRAGTARCSSGGASVAARDRCTQPEAPTPRGPPPGGNSRRRPHQGDRPGHGYRATAGGP